jgi:hypothetical protein
MGGAAGPGGSGGIATCSDDADCEDGDECTEDSCNVGNGVCDQTILDDGTVCDFGGVAGTCQAGACVDDYEWQTPQAISTGNTAIGGVDIATRPNGDAVVIWNSADDTTYRLWAADISTGSGFSFGSPGRIDAPGDEPAGGGRIGFDSEGDGLVVWTQEEGGTANVWARRYVDGQGFGSAQTIGNSGRVGVGGVALAMNARGDAVAAWHERSAVWSASYDKDNGWSAAGLVSSGTRPLNVEIDIDSAGNAIAVWYDSNDVYSNRYEVGEGWGDRVALESSSGRASLVKILIKEDGDAVAIWVQSTVQFTNTLFAREYTVGEGWGNVRRVLPAPDVGGVGSPQLAELANGDVLLAYEKFDDTGRTSIQATRFSKLDGWGTPVMVSGWGDIGGGINGPELDSDDLGGAVAIWSTYIPGGHGTLAARFADGFGWTEPEIIDDTGPEPDERTAAYGAVTVDTAGRAIAAAVWRRENDTNNDLWANRFD